MKGRGGGANVPGSIVQRTSATGFSPGVILAAASAHPGRWP